jgi:hypothetical protein
MLSGANDYVSNPSVNYDIHKIIFAGKEHFTFRNIHQNLGNIKW